MKTLLFLHGWGFDASFWEPVMAHLPEFRCEAVDLGFRGEARLPQVANPVVVGHSMGFATALERVERPWAAAVSVNGFARFSRAPDFPNGVGVRGQERMIAALKADPAPVMAEFMARCGTEAGELSGYDFARMAEALEWLKDCDLRPQLAALDCPVLALGGARDQIVPEAMTRDSFAEPIILEDGGHLLPLSHAEWVAHHVRTLASLLP